jgi:2-oxoglutarate dehydrogenase E2 component (dihydrolipoamide succinyltransferase)
MRREITIPQMGESVTEATIGTLLKPAGTMVQENDEIVELETEKVNQVLYAPLTGVINWSVKVGDSVKIGATIGFVDSEQAGAPPPQPQPPAEKPAPQPQPPPPAEKPAPMPPPPPPAAQGRRIMADAIVQELRQAPQMIPPEPPLQAPVKEGRETRRRMSKIRQTIANRLVDSLHSAAMLTTFNEVDMSAIMELRAKYKESFLEKHGVKLGFMSFFVKAVVEGLKAFPDFNSYLDADEIVTRHYYDIGIAVGAPKGLVVPVVRGCDWLSFAEIEKQIATFAQKAAASKLTIEDLEGGGFTITNGGVYGSLLSTPILNPPQVGILGMHKIMKRPVVVDEAVVIRPMMYLALSYDHRIVDGKEAVTFLIHVKEVLEDPSRLMFLDKDG